MTWALANFPSLHHLFCLSEQKTRWTMAVDRVGLKNYILRTSTSVVSLPIFPISTSNHVA